MENRIFFRSFPYFFIFFFLFFEFIPIHLFGTQLIKPYMTFTILYCWICLDFQRFSPIMLLIIGLFYDFLQSEVVGLTAIMFLILQYIQRRQQENLLSNDFKKTWLKFIIGLIFYTMFFYSVNYFFRKIGFDLVKILICSALSIAFFPLFFSIIDKLSEKFKKIND